MLILKTAAFWMTVMGIGGIVGAVETAKKMSWCKPAGKDKPVNLKERAAFLILILSASAMDSDSQILPGILTIIMLLALLRQAG